MGVPQFAQNLAADGTSLPHSVQCLTAGAIACPQLMQNFAPLGLAVEQDAHTAPATAVGGAGAGVWAGAGACA